MAETARIPFTQFMRPNGIPKPVYIIRPASVMEKAALILEAGLCFECEALLTGQASFTISDDDGDYAFAVVSNGPNMHDAIDGMILGFDLSKDHRSERAA